MPDLVLSDLCGTERQRFAFSTPRRAWQACHMVRSQLRAHSAQVLILGDLPGDTGFKVNAQHIHIASVDAGSEKPTDTP